MSNVSSRPGTNTTAEGAVLTALTNLSTTPAGQAIAKNSDGTFSNVTAGGGITWNNVTGTSQSMAINNGYIANNASLVTMTLPAVAAVGSVIQVAGAGAGGYKVAQNSGQTIHFGTSATTTGTGGSVTPQTQYEAFTLLCIIANTDWMVFGAQGNPFIN